MALSASVEWEVDRGAVGASDANGGGFNAANVNATKTATDNYTYGASFATFSYTDLYSDGANLNTLKSDARPFVAADAGHIIHLTGVGTHRTATLWFEIVSVAAGVATLDANAWSADASDHKDATGVLGGALLTIGGAGPGHVGGNIIWVKYNASAYTATSTSSNVANGVLTLAAGTIGVPTLLRGYETTPGDETANRPTFAWGVNAASGYLVTGGAYCCVENLICDGQRASYTATRALSMGVGRVRRVKVMSTNSRGIVATGSNLHLVDVEFFDCTGGNCLDTSNYVVECVGCHWRACAYNGVYINGGSVRLVRCLFAGFTGGIYPVSGVGSTVLVMEGTTIYSCASHGVNLSAASIATIANSHFENCGGYAVNPAVASPGVNLINCSFYNNTSGNYPTANIPARNITGLVAITDGSPLENAAGGDYRPNATALRGALMRGAGFPATYPGNATANAPDIGAYQHADPAAGGGIPPRITQVGGRGTPVW